MVCSLCASPRCEGEENRQDNQTKETQDPTLDDGHLSEGEKGVFTADQVFTTTTEAPTPGPPSAALVADRAGAQGSKQACSGRTSREGNRARSRHRP